jgi:hypothetical protein
LTYTLELILDLQPSREAKVGGLFRYGNKARAGSLFR